MSRARPNADRIWVWRDTQGCQHISEEPAPKEVNAHEYVRANYTYRELRKRAESDDGIDMEVLLRALQERIDNQQRRIAQLEEQLRFPQVNAAL